MNILVIGSGGREHAIAWTLARSPQAAQIYVAPGNGGTACERCENVPIPVDDFAELVSFARDHAIALTVVGPENPLADGIVDVFQEAGLVIWGPRRAAAQLEASKSFAKDFMRRHAIPTADYGVFTDYEAACAFVDDFGRDVVVKADGLTAGKGVLVCGSGAEAKAALHRVMIERAFGDAGQCVVIEERLHGREISVLAFCDGQTVVPMPVARDHKRVFDGDQGPNTGGMGAFSPALDISAEFVADVRRTVLQRAVDGMAAEGTPYVGVLYAGLMITPTGPQVLEFNCRFGDPETQVILPRLQSDLVEVFQACIEGRLDQLAVRWSSETCATVVLASGGYPGPYRTGLPIDGLDCIPADLMVFHAGTARRGAEVMTAGGRVLAVTALAANLPAALARAYAGADLIQFEDKHCRRDIGRSVL